MIDITKLILSSGNNTFKNNKIYTGNFTIAGPIAQASGSIYTQTVSLSQAPDLVSVQFYFPAMNIAAEWSEYGPVSVIGNDPANGYNNWTYICILSSSISGNNVILTASFANQFLSSPTITSTPFPYRIIDYSVF